MKKIFSLFVSAVLGATALTSVSVCAAEAASDKDSMVLLGDSIAAGYTRKGNVEHNYGEICGDYLGCDVYNYAKVGDTTDQLLEKIASFSDEQKKNLSEAEYVVISIGGNDIMGYMAKSMLAYADSRGIFKEGYSSKDIPATPHLTDLTNMLDIDGLKTKMKDAKEALAFTGEMGSMTDDICGVSKRNQPYSGGYVGEHIIPNIQKAVNDIKQVNPDAKVYVQTIFQPLQMDPAYVSSKYGEKSDMSTLINLFRYELERMMKSYSDQLANVTDIETVDVLGQFTSLDVAPDASNPGNAHYFIDVQTEGLSNIDIHPNQKGHVAIAAAILEKIGKLHKDNGLLRNTFESFSDKADYPAIALATYEKVAGSADTSSSVKLGDVNGDGFIDAVDSSKALKEYAALSSENGKGTFTEAQKKAADIDKNGIIDSVDASKILSYYSYVSSSTEASPKTIEEFWNVA